MITYRLFLACAYFVTNDLKNFKLVPFTTLPDIPKDVCANIPRKSEPSWLVYPTISGTLLKSPLFLRFLGVSGRKFLSTTGPYWIQSTHRNVVFWDAFSTTVPSFLRMQPTISLLSSVGHSKFVASSFAYCRPSEISCIEMGPSSVPLSRMAWWEETLRQR